MPQSSSADELAKLHQLLKDGIISQQEFDDVKRRIIYQGEQPSTGSKRPIPPLQTPRFRQPEPIAKEKRSAKSFFLIAIFLLGGFVVLGSLFGSDETSDDANNQSAVATRGVRDARSATVTPDATSTVPLATDVPPTATAIPRTGIQTIQLSITIQNDWKAWGEGCVGGGDTEWVGNQSVVAIAPDNVSGTFRGVELGAGTLANDDQCQWSVLLTTRASDSYRIQIDDYDVVCHSNKMLPTGDGFFAAVVIDGKSLECATVVSVTNEEGTPMSAPTPIATPSATAP